MITFKSVGRALRRTWTAGRQIFFGMTTYGWARDLRHEREEVERLFMLVTFGHLVGLPVLPPYYTLRLVPFIVPMFRGWKRGLLRERDWTDMTNLIEGCE